MKIKTKVNDDFLEYWGDITDIIKEIMGDIVSSAYILLYEDYKGDSISMSDIRMISEKIIKEYRRSGRLECDSSTVFITFKNSNSVIFRNSEWGTIQRDNKLTFLN